MATPCDHVPHPSAGMQHETQALDCDPKENGAISGAVLGDADTRGYSVRSWTFAPGAFFITDWMPLSRADSDV